MLDMSFASFLTLLIISLIAAVVVHYAIRYRVLAGADGFLWKWVVGWVGAWLGTPVLGHWFNGVNISHVYVIPAFLGGFIGAFLAAAIWKAEAKVVAHHVG
jgi:uncharacterized membrane protein YeaQ/YmgE (transglycosylase-associated protein family)